MKINHITSQSNSLLKRVRSLHERKYRERDKLFLIEGVRAVNEAFNKNLKVQDLIVSESYLRDHGDEFEESSTRYTGSGSQVSSCDDRIFRELSDTASPAGILAVAQMPAASFEQLVAADRTFIVVANAVQDPGNLGTMIRTALAASATGMILIKGTVDPYNPKVVRAAMGALFALPVLWDMTLVDTLQKLREYEVPIVACDTEGRQNLFDAHLSGPLALVFGNEANGFAAGELELMDSVVSIPMNPASESLNVATSAAIAMFTVVQQRLKLTK